MGTIEIYYFSGTGNSLHMARELQKSLSDAELIPMVGLLHKKSIEANAEIVGFVFPIHFARMPVAMREFLGKINLLPARYIFAVATRVGSTHRAFIDIDRILRRKGRKLDARFTLNMPSNDPKFKDYMPASPQEIEELESAARIKLDAIQKIIMKREQSLEEDTDATMRLPGLLLKTLPLFTAVTGRMGVQPEFFADSRCAGCGTCAKVCLSGKIKIVDSKPVWQKSVPCFNCYACLNYCPEEAVQMKSGRFMKLCTDQNGRYSHPFATANDIAEQKR